MAKDKKAKAEKTDQKTLFGEQDFVYNVLQTDIADISDDISNSRKKIEKLEKHIKAQEERREEVLKASRIVEKQRRMAEADKVETQRAEDEETTQQQEQEKQAEEETAEVEVSDTEKTPY